MSVEYPDLFEIGERAFQGFLAEFRAYGLEADDGLALHRSHGMLCYYSFVDRQIYLSVPDFRASTGKLQMLMFRQWLRAESNAELMRFLEIFIPFIVAHEMAHHFRHRAGLFGTDNWHEEQLANCLAAAVNKYRIPPVERAFAVQFLQRAVQALGEQLGLGDSAIDSYFDVVHALQASNRISTVEMDNFRLAQGVAPTPTSPSHALRHSGTLTASDHARLEQREALISNFNQDYASDPVRYVYYQAGWVYLTIKSTEANYVDEFARQYLNRDVPFLQITRSGTVGEPGLAALYLASVAAGATSTTLSRYFYKRYRSELLEYLERGQQAAGVAGHELQTVNFEVLAIWDERSEDPLNFLAGMVPTELRKLFPRALRHSDWLTLARLPADLPSTADVALWNTLAGTDDAQTARTVQLFERFDRLDLFHVLPPEVILELGRKSYQVRYAAGEVVVWQGDLNNDVFILLQGQLQTEVQGSPSSATIHEGELFGEIAWLTHGSRSATVRAATAAICLVLKDHDLQILAYRSPAILHSIASTLAYRLRSRP
ncbi:MAG: cyclic nucleotide-binding domain-containing protein [Xanthomonadales bacterium]|nr:cyclic nucleotide-binding domain-containing protein [Xanthomonadales bacterium]